MTANKHMKSLILVVFLALNSVMVSMGKNVVIKDKASNNAVSTKTAHNSMEIKVSLSFLTTLNMGLPPKIFG